MKLTAPFPWFGGKSRASSLVWERLGDVPNYVEPFAGSLAVLLGRPHKPRTETVNDLDGYLSNFWRAARDDPEGVAHYADLPVNECDLHARHSWLVARKEGFVARLMGDPEYYDAKVAGWWVWGLCCWIGHGWCSGEGPWSSVDGVFCKSGGRQGVNRKLPHLGNRGKGVNRPGVRLIPWMSDLSDRLADVRVACGDWSRVCGPSPTYRLTGVFLDPPYTAETGRGVLYSEESFTVAHQVREWAISEADNPLKRIALCGYEGEHELPGWDCIGWKTKGGYGSQSTQHDNPNAKRERIWFSPHCLSGRQGVLF